MNYSVKELFCENNGQKIYGRMYMPTVKKDKYPLVICAHGFNANCDYHDEFGRQLAAGVPVFMYLISEAAAKNQGVRAQLWKCPC